MSCENPLRAQYWFGRVDPRPQALFRWLLGLAICHDLINYARDLRAFITDEGMLPRGFQADPRAHSPFEFIAHTGPAACVFGLGFAAVVSFTLGYRPRLSAALSWLFLTALHTRNLYVTDGGDDLVRYLMFLSIFADLGGCWSIDAWRSGIARRPAATLGLRFLQLHIALLYFCAARLKFRHGWLAQNVVFQTLQLTGFLRPPGQALGQLPALCRASTLMTLALEFSFAFLAFSPVRVGLTRALAIFAGVAVQFGILVTMRVGVFTETMLAAMALYTRPEWFAWLGQKLGRGAPVVSEDAPGERDFGPAIRRDPWRALAFAVLCFQFVSLAWGPFAARRFPLPHWAIAGREWLWLDQPFGLFDVVYDIPSWRAEGITQSGAHVEALAQAVPDLLPVVRWRFSRWYKFTFKERERAFRFAPLGRFICREYQAHTGEALREFSLIEKLTPPLVYGHPREPAHERERWHQVCE